MEINFTELMQLGAGALVVAALLVLAAILRGKDAASAGVMRLSMEVVTATFNTGIATLKDAQEGQRLFYQAKVDDLFKELVAERQERKEEVVKLQKRISDLECEVQEKDKRIETLEEEVENKDKRVKALEAEVARLNGRMNGKQDKKAIKSAAKK